MQNYSNIQYIVIDGGSTDKTVNIADKYKHFIKHLVSEPDKGIYDAMNKGIRLATGDVVGILNADDVFADRSILSTIADAFKNSNADVVYGDLDYVDKNGTVSRKWRSGTFTPNSFNLGWMPPHPTFYCKRYLFEKFGFYSMNYGTAADYELMLRFLFVNKVEAVYVKKVLVRMKTGGKSNESLANRLKGCFFDLRAIRKNGIRFPFLTIALKPLLKLNQYI
jgi:glycosyltransferase involved in cell wall biosynthesis